MSRTPPLAQVEVIDLSEDSHPAAASDACTAATTESTCSRTDHEDAGLFRGVRLRDLEFGDRLGARRDGGDGFQVGTVEGVFCGDFELVTRLLIASVENCPTCQTVPYSSKTVTPFLQQHPRSTVLNTTNTQLLVYFFCTQLSSLVRVSGPIFVAAPLSPYCPPFPPLFSVVDQLSYRNLMLEAGGILHR